jgi:hypothetical protein
MDLMKIIVPQDLDLKAGSYESATPDDVVITLDFTVERPLDAPPPDDKPADPPLVADPPIKAPPVVVDPPVASGPAPAPAAIKAWSPAELGWVDQAPSANRVDVDVVLTDGTHLSLYDAPLGVSPLKLADGSLHDHLTVVRHRDAVKVENSWMRGTQNFVGSLNVQIDNALVFNQSSVRFDLGCATTPIRTGLPQYPPKPVDKSLIPNYGGGATKQLLRVGKDFGINGLGFDTTAGMGQGGGRIDIGILPGQSLAYAINGLYFEDLQDFEDHAAVWPVHYRDEATGQPVDPTVQVVASVLPAHLGYKYTRGVNPITGKTASPNVPNVAHLTHHAVVGYLATGSDLYAEELAFWASYAIISQNAFMRGYELCIIEKNSATRHVAWGLTMQIFAARILPESYPMKAAASTSVTNTRIHWWDEQYAPGKPCNNIFGFMLCVAYNGKDGTLGMSPWMEHFLTSALYLGVRLGYEELRPWAEFSASFAVGAITGGMCSQLANNYNLFVCDPAKFTNRADAEASSAQLVGSWADIDARTRWNEVQGGDAEYAKPCGQMKLLYAAEPGTLYGANGSPESFVANMQPALAAAVDLGIPNAVEAWAKFNAMAPAGDYSAHAQFNIVPRTTVPS